MAGKSFDADQFLLAENFGSWATFAVMQFNRCYELNAAQPIRPLAAPWATGSRPCNANGKR
jgi:hypothetical protein